MTTSVAIRELCPEDEPAVVALWNSALGELFPLRPRLLHQTTLGDPELDPGDALVAWNGSQIVGFVLARTRRPAPGIREDVAYLEAVIVDPAQQRQGLGRRLVGEAEAHLRAKGARQIWVSGGPSMLFPGVCTLLPGAQQFFERMGYGSPQQVHDVIGDLEAMRRPERVDAALANARAEVRPCSREQHDAAIAFLRQCFPGGWPEERRRHRLMGARADEIYLLWVGDQIVGLAQDYLADSPVLGPNVNWGPALGVAEGGLGPIGLAPAWRGKGLGLALLALALEGLRQRGVRHAIIDWTRLIDFYGLLGFRVWRSYLRSSKELL